MCVKLPPRDLNPDPCPPHPTSTYTCGVTIALRVCGGSSVIFKLYPQHILNWALNVMSPQQLLNWGGWRVVLFLYQHAHMHSSRTTI